MNAVLDIIVYPFLFVALFFEVFLMLTFFDRTARERRAKKYCAYFPTVSIIVPCYNEEKNVKKTIDSLLALDYPKEKLAIIAVDDGSTDDTFSTLKKYESNPQVRILHKKNGGKYSALNAGIAASESQFIGCLDADSVVSVHALKEIVSHFDSENVGAVTAAMSVYEPRGVLERMQQAEYLLGITLRHALSALNGLYVTPGPFTIFRSSVFQKIGLFKAAHDTEDMEMAMRMQKNGFEIQNAPRARVYTSVPTTVSGLIRQRTRWTSGFLRNAIDYKEFFGNPHYGTLGFIVLPLAVLSIYSRMLLFPIAWVQNGQSLFHFLVHMSEVPLSYTFRIPSFDWFFAPASSLFLLTLVAFMFMLGFVFAGAYISRTKTNMGPSVFWYIALYGLIAPLWMVRAVIDVTFGIRRSWY